MKKFLAVYTGSEKSANVRKWNKLGRKARQERERAGIAAWQAWVAKNAESIVDHGSPLGSTKSVGLKGVSGIRNQLAAWTVVQAKSHAAAARLFVNHPHFTIFPGDAVEVMECLPIPGM